MRARTPRGRWRLLALLSMTAGAVDAIGFLALGGLLTAHITGNIVVVVAHYLTGGFGEVGPLMAVPVFIVVLGGATAAAAAIGNAGDKARTPLLLVHAALLAGALGIGVAFGPFADPDRPMALLVGMLAVAAMATQNALVRLALPGAPSTAVMTTNTTQMIVDLVTLARGRGEPDGLARSRRRAGLTAPCIVGFVVGCACAGTLAAHVGLWALAFPVVLAVLAVVLGERAGDDDSGAEDSRARHDRDALHIETS